MYNEEGEGEDEEEDEEDERVENVVGSTWDNINSRWHL